MLASEYPGIYLANHHQYSSMRGVLISMCNLWLANAQTGARPNVLFMMADQLRWDAVGYAGNNVAITPALDRIASEGLIIKYSWSSTPTCTPARAALVTGKSPWNHGMLGYGTIAPRYPVELPRMMAEAGYITAAFGKNHFGWNVTSNNGYDHGYQSLQLYDGLGSWDETTKGDHWDGEFDEYDAWFEKQLPGKDPMATLDKSNTVNGANDGWNGWHGAAFVYEEFYHPTAWVAREAIDFLTSYNASGAPFYVKVSFHRPHSPYDPPARTMNKFNPAALPPIITGGNWDVRFRGEQGDPSGCGPSDADAWCGLMPTNMTDVSRCAYYGSVAFVDEQVGNIYATLEKTNLLNNTFIIWSADHGDGQGDHYHWRKGYPYEFSAHVPMLFRWPESYQSEIKRGTTLHNVVTELRDVFHTAIDIAGIAAKVPSGTFKAEDGKSMLCLLKDPTGLEHCDYDANPGPWRQWIDMEHATCYNESNHWNALTDGRMKYVFRAWFGDEQLFNLTADAGELHELSGEPSYHSELLKWRLRMVTQFENEGRGPAWVKNGTLQRRTTAQTYSPNYPGGGGGGGGGNGPTCPKKTAAALTVGSSLTLASNQDGKAPQDIMCQDLLYQKESFGDTLSVLAREDLCLGYDSSVDVLATNAITLVLCNGLQRTVNFNLKVNNTNPDHAQPQAVVHVETGLCVTAAMTSDTNASARISLAECKSTDVEQQWVFGASGRLCQSKGCITMMAPST
eukprot:m.46182 g.46182  ORF g.46182 m.46182 type:complete len:736 (+) comp20166_c0_seq2:116-2323(+)